ncbi:MAG: hypothetical protein KAG20_03245 [Cocleimonas sp.]|nr:hypothetical protein [Cocleimonas sp.]
MKITPPILLLSCVCFTTTPLFAEEIDHSKMDHSQHMQMMAAPTAPPSMPSIPAPPSSASQTPVLTEAGNDIFGTIQETIKKLDANTNTDWSKVDLEALRQHLIDMKHFTVDVEVISKKDTKKGMEIVIKPTTKAANKALSRAMSAHPEMLKSETGWTMKAKTEGNTFRLNVTTDTPPEVARLRGLGYIGVMALGNHHQIHHWMMASGANPHGKHMHH